MNKLFSTTTMVLAAALAFTVSFSGLLQAGAVEDGIASRIQAVGTVCVEGDDCAKALTVAAAEPKSVEENYNSGCLACHASGAAGAPKFRVAADWTTRLAQGIDVVYANAINGKGGMPAKGLCASCSDQEIKDIVDYMIEGL